VFFCEGLFEDKHSLIRDTSKKEIVVKEMKKKRLKLKAGMFYCALTVVLSLTLALPSAAFAYFNRGPVGISVGSSSTSVQAGASTSLSVTLSPASDQQTAGCGMAECPQTCGDKGCLDANGQCICAGTGYTTYTPSVRVSSSNGAVATASYAGGAVAINGVSEGTATITLVASLRQFTDGQASISVTVTARPGGAGSSSGTNSTSTTTNTTATGQNPGLGQGANVNNSAGGDSGVVALASDVEQAQGSQDGAGVSDDERIVDMNGWIVHLIRLRPETNVAEKLLDIAGRDEEMTLWYGGTVEGPDYSWTFQGADLDADVLTSTKTLDLSITASPTGQGLVAGLLAGSKNTLVLDFAHEGALPAPAVIYMAAPAYLSEGDTLSLYSYDEQAGTFIHRLDGLSVESGYIAFEIDHCSIWAISSEPIDTLVPATLPDAVNPLGVSGEGVSTSTLPLIFVLVGVAVAVVLAVIVVLFVRTRRRKIASVSN
jgi:hypothetical protein